MKMCALYNLNGAMRSIVYVFDDFIGFWLHMEYFQNPEIELKQDLSKKIQSKII